MVHALPHNQTGSLHTDLSLHIDRRYHLLELLNSGTDSLVYRAQERATGRRVVIKILRPESAAAIQERTRAQLQQEAMCLKRLPHPPFPWLFESQQNYLVREFVDGYSLQVLMQHARQRIPLTDLCSIGQYLCQLLRLLHEHRVLFCDLSAANILLSEHGVHLVDFGIAHLMGQPRPSALDGLGTPGYAAPEQYPDSYDPLSTASDVYALGAVLHFLATGHDPTTNAPAPWDFVPLPEDVPPALALLIADMLDPLPAARPSLAYVSTVLSCL